jgi:hypothetical protein
MDSAPEQDAPSATEPVAAASDDITFADYAHSMGPKKIALVNAVRAHLRIKRSETATYSRATLEAAAAELHASTNAKG